MGDWFTAVPKKPHSTYISEDIVAKMAEALQSCTLLNGGAEMFYDEDAVREALKVYEDLINESPN